MSPSRRAALVLLAAVLGIALAAAVTWGTSQLVSQRIGLSSEPLTAGRALLPRAPSRGARHPTSNTSAPATTKSTPTPTSTPAAPATPVAPAPTPAAPVPHPAAPAPTPAAGRERRSAEAEAVRRASGDD